MPRCLSSLETAEYLDELIDFKTGRINGGILVRLIQAYPSLYLLLVGLNLPERYCSRLFLATDQSPCSSFPIAAIKLTYPAS
jgi:hypothetical protein